ncbi:YihY/virulence factor BrkB family protein [Hazenella sp. IB182357]|uniref:YihY/virulence factor BrkB family protein n=1 Tax=Polycladospora coralii TaxID=2771432 RepID=A0A926N6P8_9BACL|nr:YihY/virulence factor BrkB family protein [Polycladospora coralii]MBD1372611.1 YihY/virulence factor BrkB family protein [Polycladospora coralii]MBS7531282.1 YihY/virulence factor BrkB family protein [Polycladospora coralii]
MQKRILIQSSKKLYKEMNEENVRDVAAALAFYFLFSLFPLLIFTVSLLPYLSIEVHEILDLLQRFAPDKIYQTLKDPLMDVFMTSNQGILSLGIIITIWSASNGMNALIRALNIVYGVDEDRSFFKLRLLSILLTFGLVLVIFVTLALPVFGQLLIDLLTTLFFFPTHVLQIFAWIRWLVSPIIMTIVITGIYYFGPNIQLTMRQVLWGSVAASLSWQMITLGFSYYIKHFGNYTATYGSLGGIIILLLWFYMMGFILLFWGKVNALKNRKRYRA